MKICTFIPVACLLALTACKPSTDQDRGGQDAGGQTAKSLTTGGAGNERRAALVIGNNAYQNATPLKTASNDAQTVWESLRDLGFSAGDKPVIDASLESLVEAVDDFKKRARGASAAVVYFAGHGIEHDGVNYLIPVDAVLERAIQLKTQAYSLNTLLDEMKSLQVPTRLVILDCCRNNPLPERSWSRGEATLVDISDESLGGATMVVFSAAPGTRAKDRLTAQDTHSPFAAALLQQMAVPGQGLFNLFGEVEKSVFAATSESQMPKVRFSGDVSPFASFLMHPGQPGAKSDPSLTHGPVEPPAPRPLVDSAKAGQVLEFKLSGDQVIRFCYCPPGSFTMGSPTSEKDRGYDEDEVQVRISRGFWMAQTPCTQRQWSALMGNNPSTFEGNDLPVETVSWDDAQDFITKLSGVLTLPTGWRAALPTEAQWEYACRAGTKSAFSFGDVLNGKQANCNGEHPYGTKTSGPNLSKTCAVASYPANAWGLYDMHGNVLQWCADQYALKLPGGTDPTGPKTGGLRPMRGGSWWRDAANCRAAARHLTLPDDKKSELGFRPALVPWAMTEEDVQRRIAMELAKRASVTISPPQVSVPVSLPESATAGQVLQFQLPGGEVMKFCYCPAGSFTMGSPKDEKDRAGNEDQVQVRLSKGFWMAQTPCTQEQWATLMGNDPRPVPVAPAGAGAPDVPFKGVNLPVETVSWEHAQTFIKKLNEVVRLPDGWKAALPTEAQWEYACRAGTRTAYSFGDALNGTQANCDGNKPYGTTAKGPFLKKTSPVASYPPNPWGLYDMHGNVWQWCADWAAEELQGGTDPVGPENTGFRVDRGGSWMNAASYCRSARRGYAEPFDLGNHKGFRIALVQFR